MAAPLADSSQQTGSQEIKQTRKNPDHRKIGFTNKDVEMWTNPCSSESIMDSNISVPDVIANYKEVS